MTEELLKPLEPMPVEEPIVRLEDLNTVAPDPAKVPIFDMRFLSWKHIKEINLLEARVFTRASVTGEGAEAAAQEQNASFEALQGYISKVLVSVPLSWLVPDAPPDLDWRDPASFDWLQAGKFPAIAQAFKAAQGTENAGKN